jgi:hypothetical protein
MSELIQQKEFSGQIFLDSQKNPFVKWKKDSLFFPQTPYLVVRPGRVKSKLIGCFEAEAWSHQSLLTIEAQKKTPSCLAWKEFLKDYLSAEKLEDYQFFFEGDLVFHPFLPEILKKKRETHQTHFRYPLTHFLPSAQESWTLSPFLKEEVKHMNLFLNEHLKAHLKIESSLTRKAEEFFPFRFHLNPLFPSPPPLASRNTGQGFVQINIFYEEE